MQKLDMNYVLVLLLIPTINVLPLSTPKPSIVSEITGTKCIIKIELSLIHDLTFILILLGN